MASNYILSRRIVNFFGYLMTRTRSGIEKRCPGAARSMTAMSKPLHAIPGVAVADSSPEEIETALGYASERNVPGGVVHELPADLRRALIANATALDAWKDITPLARNEFICWVEDAKQHTTRERRIRVAQDKLEAGQRRPCCWPGCKHRERTGS
jgi:hypothetical protein